MGRKLEDTRLAAGPGRLHRGRSRGLVPAGQVSWAGWLAWRAGSAGMAGMAVLVGGHGRPDRQARSAGLAGRVGGMAGQVEGRVGGHGWQGGLQYFAYMHVSYAHSVVLNGLNPVPLQFTCSDLTYSLQKFPLQENLTIELIP